MMNDPLLQELIAAFRSRKLQPIRRLFFLHDDSGDFACPLVALAVLRGKVDTSDPDVAIDSGANAAVDWAAKAFGEDWTLGFLDGFDGKVQAINAPDYQNGYRLGLEAAKQLTPHDPPA